MYEMGNKSHVWNHQPAINGNDFAGSLWLWLTVCHGKIHPFLIGKTNQNEFAVWPMEWIPQNYPKKLW